MTVKSISLSDTTSTWREHKNIYDEDNFYLSIYIYLSIFIFYLSIWPCHFSSCAWPEYGTASMCVASDDSIMISLFWILWSINAINKWGRSLACLLKMYAICMNACFGRYFPVCPMISKLNNLSIHWKDSSDCWKRYLQNVWRTLQKCVFCCGRHCAPRH